jgi:hypothetical protein
MEIFNKIENKALGEVDGNDYNLDNLELLGEIKNKELSTHSRLFYDKDKNHTIIDIWDGKYNVCCGWDGKFTATEIIYFIATSDLKNS